MHRHISERYSVPAGDSPYARAKRAQIVEKDPNRAIALFWRAINEGDRADSALKDMAMLMKKQDRSEEAIQAIKSLRNLCSVQAQESLDNILLHLYKRCRRLDGQIDLMRHKLIMIERGLGFNGQRTKKARSEGKIFNLTVEQETVCLLGNLGCALMLKEDYAQAEAVLRRTLMMHQDYNKMCNLSICLVQQGRVLEAKEVLMQVKRAPSQSQPDPLSDSDSKAFQRAQEMLKDLDNRTFMSCWSFEAILDQSAAATWQPHPCVDYYLPSVEKSGKENLTPFYRSKTGNQNPGLSGNLKRKSVEFKIGKWNPDLSENRCPDLPIEKEFSEALIEAVLSGSALPGGKRVRHHFRV